MTLPQIYSPKYSKLHSSFGQKHFRLLDIGAGNHSASKYKKVFSY